MYRWFDEAEFTCSETGTNEIKPELIHALDELRERLGRPLVITSGYRHPTHSAERNKTTGPGTHSQGIAADIAVNNGFERMTLVHEALKLGFPAIGVAKTFIHLDIRKTDKPVMWTY